MILTLFAIFVIIIPTLAFVLICLPRVLHKDKRSLQVKLWRIVVVSLLAALVLLGLYMLAAMLMKGYDNAHPPPVMRGG